MQALQITQQVRLLYLIQFRAGDPRRALAHGQKLANFVIEQAFSQDAMPNHSRGAKMTNFMRLQRHAWRAARNSSLLRPENVNLLQTPKS